MATDAFSSGAGNGGNRAGNRSVSMGDQVARVELENRVGLAPRLVPMTTTR